MVTRDDLSGYLPWTDASVVAFLQLPGRQFNALFRLLTYDEMEEMSERAIRLRTAYKAALAAASVPPAVRDAPLTRSGEMVREMERRRLTVDELGDTPL